MAEKKRKKMISGAELLCRCLVEQDVKYLFGYTGGAIMPVYDQFPKFPQFTHIMARHEQGAAFSAQGYARATGQVGVCIATSGPGAANLITGIADAMMDSVPILAITGQVATSVIGTDAFQESDVVGMMLPITKQSYLVSDGRDIPRIVNEAFYLATHGRPGPVHIDIPKDIAIAMIPDEGFDTKIRYDHHQTRGVKDYDIAAAEILMAEAKQPVVFLGHGVILSNAQKEVRAFVEKSGMPFAFTLHGLSALPADHPQALGMMGMHGTVPANRAIEHADLIIAFGMRFDDRVTGKLDEYASQAKVIHIEIDRAEIHKNVKADVAINSDLKPAIKALTQVVRKGNYKEWFAFAAANRAEWEAVDPVNTQQGLGPNGKLLMADIVAKLSAVTKGQDNVLADVGQHQMFTARYYNFQRFNTWFNSGGAGTMGFALPAAIGVKLARPTERVWAVIGDGCFQMNIQELGTIMEQQLDIKIVLLNNNYLGMVKQWQDLFFDDRFVGTYLHNPDFIKLASAYDIPGETVTERSEIEGAFKRAMKHKGPYLLEFKTDLREMVLPMVASGAPFREMKITL